MKNNNNVTIQWYNGKANAGILKEQNGGYYSQGNN